MPDPRLRPYERPEMPFERKSSLGEGLWRWSVAGFEFGGVVVLFFLGGRWLDATLSTHPWFTVTGALLGVGAGMVLLLRPALRDAFKAPSGDETGGAAGGSPPSNRADGDAPGP